MINIKFKLFNINLPKALWSPNLNTLLINLITMIDQIPIIWTPMGSFNQFFGLILWLECPVQSNCPRFINKLLKMFYYLLVYVMLKSNFYFDLYHSQDFRVQYKQKKTDFRPVSRLLWELGYKPSFTFYGRKNECYGY